MKKLPAIFPVFFLLVLFSACSGKKPEPWDADQLMPPAELAALIDASAVKDTAAVEDPAVENLEVENTAVENLKIENTAIEDPEVGNPEVGDLEVGDTAVENPEVEDAGVKAPAAAVGDPAADLPLIVCIGPGAMIPGSKDVGQTGEEPNLEKLRTLLSEEDRDRDIVLYCGCCPFGRCPNIRPAFSLLNDMDFTNHRLLDLSTNLKTDWIEKGYPVGQK